MFVIHSHILPGVDDGPKTVEDSIKILEEMSKQSITHVVATPHFNAIVQDFDAYKELVTDSYKTLLDNCKGLNLPQISVGCEVLYFYGIGKSSGIRQLTLCGSKYLLIEFPFYDLSFDMIKDVKQIRDRSGIIPIIAHIERYSRMRRFKELLSLVSDGYAYAQLNAASLFDSALRKQSINLIKKGYISFLATDSHSIENRPPLMSKALEEIELVLGSRYKENLVNNSKNFCEEIFCVPEVPYAK